MVWVGRSHRGGRSWRLVEGCIRRLILDGRRCVVHRSVCGRRDPTDERSDPHVDARMVMVVVEVLVAMVLADHSPHTVRR